MGLQMGLLGGPDGQSQPLMEVQDVGLVRAASWVVNRTEAENRKPNGFHPGLSAEKRKG